MTKTEYKAHILVIDDEVRMAESLQALLSGLDYTVDMAFDGNEAAEKIRQGGYDLIISDIKLPHKTGLELLKLAHEIDPEMVVILITAYASVESAVDAIGQGAYDYLVKPVEFSHLKIAVERALDKHFSNRARLELMDKLKGKNRQLRRRIAEINALYKAGNSLSTTIEIKELLTQIIGLATKVIGVRTGSVMLLDTEKNCLRISAAIGVDSEIIRETELPLGTSIAGSVAQTGEPIMIDNIDAHPKFKRNTESQYETESLISVPLLVKGEVIGVINLTDKIDKRKFTTADLKLLITLASQAAIAIDDAQHYEEASRKLKEFVALYEIASELPNMEDFSQMARLVHFHIKNIMPVEMTLWMSYDVISGKLTFNFWDGWGREFLEQVETAEIPLEKDQIENPRERTEIILEYLNTHLPVDGKIKSFRAVPIYTKGHFYGLFCMGSLSEDAFHVDHEYLASIVTSQAASLYERQRAMLNATRLMTMGNMMSEISHDLRKPLTNIKGGLQIMKERWPEEANKDGFFEMAQQELSRLSELVRELVDFSNPKKYQTVKKRINEALDRAMKLVQQDLVRNEIELDMDLEDNLPLVAINYNQIIEILLNMFMNAIDAMEKGGKLSVKAERYTDPESSKLYVQIFISDTGKGIQPENIDRVFDRYFTTKPSGTGLGLAVVERIIKAHNGFIEVKSKLDEGSTFKISLPVI
jgi:signal transduction histidine kinase/DNA-binding response OmpR family regulator/putative methionine-R-sulfoxide reductase with GAF domain